MGALPQESWIAAASLAGVRVDGPVERYDPASNAVGLFAVDGSYSWCRAVQADYDCSVVLPGCRLIDTNWSRDWLQCISCGLKADGQLVLPYRLDGKASEPAGLTPRQLDEMLGKPSKAEGGFATFEPSREFRPIQSVAGHFMTTSLAVMGSLAEYRAAELVESLSAEEWRAGFDAWRIDDSAGLKTLSADFLSETYADLARYLVFAVQGINTKSYSLWQVFQDALENDRVLRWADLGSGSGFLGIEIASQNPVHVFNVDKSLAQSRLGIDMMRCFPRLEGECSFITSRLEDVELPDDLDAVSMLTTLCYVPKEAQRSLLQRSWNALRPGGAMLIFENIKSKAYTRDYDLMLEEAELDGMLDELGGKSMYYHALTGRKMKAEAAAGKTCYRVRIKQ